MLLQCFIFLKFDENTKNKICQSVLKDLFIIIQSSELVLTPAVYQFFWGVRLRVCLIFYFNHNKILFSVKPPRKADLRPQMLLRKMKKVDHLFGQV